jgi:hypothetical protein
MRRLARIVPIAVFIVCAAASASAQEITPANLPADTSLVFFSHSSAQIRAAAPANPMVQTWYSPQTAQVKRLLVQYLVSQMAPKPGGQKFALSAENTERLLSILENSLVVGISGSSDIMALTQAPSRSSSNFMKMSGLFFILDISGKEAQFNQLWPALEAALPKEIARNKYSLAGATIEKFTGPNNTTFSAQIGSRFIWSNQQKVIEQLAVRLAMGENPGNSLAENPDFQHCQTHSFPGAVLDVFIRFPDLSKLPVPTNPQFDASASVKALHLDSMHAICGNFSMTQEGELGRWMILGDTSEGSLLSWFGANRTQFDTLALVPPSASSFTVGSFDLQALYKSLKVALGAAMPGRQQASADLMEGMLSMQLGMSIPDTLAIFRGEFASIKFPTPSGSQSSGEPKVFALTVSNPDRILDLLHKLAPASISDETRENGVTFFKTGAQIPIGGAFQTVATDTYIAITPQLLLVSSDGHLLREFVARVSSTPSAASGLALNDNPEVRRMRAMFPAEVLGFSVTDYTRSNMQKEMTDALSSADQKDKSKVTPEERPLIDALKNIPWANFIGGFHWSVSAWWKEPDGIHFETRIR